MNALVVAPVALPLVAAAVLLLAPRSTVLARVLGIGSTALVVVAAAVLLARTLGGEVPVAQIGGWPAGIAIVLALDTFGALVLLLTAAVTLLGLVYAIGTGEDRERTFTPLVLVMSAGVSGASSTADLFNLFVFVEVVLIPSYVLLTLARRRQRIAGARLYVSVNLLASTLFLGGIGLLYGVTGTVQLGQLAGVAAGSAPAALAATLLLLAMGIKSAVVPLHSWLPGSYSVAGPAVTVLFSGLLTKVGLYALFRLYAVLFDGDRRFLWVVLVVAVLTMVVGVLSAVGATAVRPVLTAHMVSQIGYVLVGLGLSTVAGLAAATFFLVQYVLVKAALFMVGGAVEVRYGTDVLARLGGGLVHRERWLAVAFAGAALALVGIPPTSGFVAKLQLATAAAADGPWWVLLAVVAVSAVTLVSMLKLWNGVFWGEPSPLPAPAGRVPATLLGPPLLLAGAAVVLGLWAQPLLAAATVAGEQLADPSAWVAAVTR
ncbi:proton-conducting transporter transmembrane domain-containing protein [Klenkia taihuensis]|uniref:Multisubunit sodium/proton antiporter, MrpD subunit (TC 2.A.63.1) n=1 Tax=Klenkia taihuensis TaxID=1225127 RepID=A0A1I1UPL8_9ACTN|nr:proton-conducting transporter membrane subunit [Klenkia taihuensis]GHE13948.1 cation:proton antiporter [Klenkia taihuensis]SFD72654.1 multisubunit sodium/proton antiporter, MrpD subunit (TC 2.A.63.1) [Klenkia taihuensis]